MGLCIGRTLTIVVLLLPSARAFQEKAAPAPAEADFTAKLDEARQLGTRGKWKESQAALTALLEQHKDQDYVRVKRAEIADAVKDCAFNLQFKPADFKELISGELVSYNPATGDIKLRYTPDKLRDFLTKGDVAGDRYEAQTLYLHPINFAGPYTIEIKGKSYPVLGVPSPVVLAAIDGGDGFQVTFGFPSESSGNVVSWHPAYLHRLKNGEWKEIDKKQTSPAKSRKPFALKVVVGSSEIGAYYDNSMFLKTAKPAALFGQVGFAHVEFSELVISGRAQTAWLQGMRDAATQKARAAFDQRYKESEHLPEWLLANKPVTVKASAKQRGYPGERKAEQEHLITKVRKLWDDDKFAEALDAVNAVPVGQLTEAAREYLLAGSYEGLGDAEHALPHCERVCTLDPQFLATRSMRAALLGVLGRRADAEKEYRDLVEKFPDRAEIYASFALTLLRAGRTSDAKAVIEQALNRAAERELLDFIKSLLVKAEKGPEWARTFEYKTDHYLVQSDIDQQVCVDAAKVLEQSYLAYAAYLKKTSDDEKQRFRVYLFSGKTGYESYAARVAGSLPMHTAGMYSPVLKQLLIWNLPDRGDMMRTVQHEGFHQYLDRLMDSPPRWFNEGLAEYHELARYKDGRWTVGQTNPDHMRLLQGKETKLVPIADLVKLDARQFYANPRLHYAESWALVHFLQNTTPANKELFKKLFQALLESGGKAAAVDQVLSGVDTGKLDLDFAAYVRALSA
ncbi:MAG: DUF1570 domain-containing protein [Planctomycetota bacterium]